MRGLNELLQQAQRMQEQLQKSQDELLRLEVTGVAGGGLVRITMNGAHAVRKVELDRQLLRDDPEMCEDLIAAAFNDAVNKLAERRQEQLRQATAGLPLPPGFKFPF